MKRAYVLLLALLLMLTGCAGKKKLNNVSVKDVCCPYEISHQKDVVELTLQDADKSGILWQLETIPDDVCDVTQDQSTKEDMCRYRISGKEEGAAQLTFRALLPDETENFVLTLVVTVDAKGKVVVSSYQHWEREVAEVDADGLQYKWNVDINGTFHFSFVNDEDSWSVRGGDEAVCIFSDRMSTPTGCKFSAQASGVGETTVELVGETTQRKILVRIQADDNGNLQLVSVQEQ